MLYNELDLHLIRHLNQPTSLSLIDAGFFSVQFYIKIAVVDGFVQF